MSTQLVAPDAYTPPRTVPTPGSRPPVAVVGAGIAGLVAATQLRRHGVPLTVYEGGKEVAGLAKSFRDADGFSHDFGAHFITNRLAAALSIGAHCRDVQYYGETVILGRRAYGYPLGLVREPRFTLSATRARFARHPKAPESAAEWMCQEYGERMAREIAIPLIEKWSGASADELAASVGDKLQGGLEHVLMMKSAARLTHRAVTLGYCREKPESAHVWHVYPDRGIGFLCERLAADLASEIQLESPVEAIIVHDERVVAVRSRGVEREVSAVVSTAPVNVLPRLVQGTTALAHLSRFRFRPMIFVNLRLDGRHLLSDTVLWTPEEQYPFFRLTEAPRSMPWLAPEGKTVITADIGAEVGDAMWSASDDELARRCIDALKAIVPDIAQRVRGWRVLRTAIAYPVFRREYEAERQAWARSSNIAGLYSIGRNGEFAHLLMEDVYWRTRRRMRELMV